MKGMATHSTSTAWHVESAQSRFPAFLNSLWLRAAVVQLVQVNTHGAKTIFSVWHSLAKALHLHVHDLFCVIYSAAHT